MSEGNSGTKLLNFTVTLSSPYTQNVSVAYNTKNATATAGSDYTATSGTLTFALGETIKTISVSINADAIVEPDEKFKITLSNPLNATISKATATGTIQNDDAAFANEVSNAITNNNQNGIKIFPNPVTNDFLQVTINIQVNESTKLALYDAGGNIVKFQYIGLNTTNIKLDLTALNSGNYFLVISDGKLLNYKEKIQVLH